MEATLGPNCGDDHTELRVLTQSAASAVSWGILAIPSRGLLCLRPWENLQGILSTTNYRQNMCTCVCIHTHACTHTHTHKQSRTWLTSDAVCGNDAFLLVKPSLSGPAPHLTLLYLGRDWSGISPTACSLLPLSVHCFSEHCRTQDTGHRTQDTCFTNSCATCRSEINTIPINF